MVNACVRFVTAVFPSDDDDVITSPYNSVLAMRQLADHADCVLPVENQVNSPLFCHMLTFANVLSASAVDRVS